MERELNASTVINKLERTLKILQEELCWLEKGEEEKIIQDTNDLYRNLGGDIMPNMVPLKQKLKELRMMQTEIMPEVEILSEAITPLEIDDLTNKRLANIMFEIHKIEDLLSFYTIVNLVLTRDSLEYAEMYGSDDLDNPSVKIVKLREKIVQIGQKILFYSKPESSFELDKDEMSEDGFSLIELVMKLCNDPDFPKFMQMIENGEYFELHDQCKTRVRDAKSPK